MDIFQLNSAYSQLTKNNIGAFISDVHSAFINKTVPTLTLINLLDKKSETCNSIGWLDRHPDGISDAERDTITVYGIVIAAEMLLLFDIHSHSALRKKALAFLECASALIKQQYDFIGKAVDALNHDFTSLGYDWAAVQNAISLDVLAYSFCSKSTHTASYIPSSSFFGQGCVQISNGLVSISSSRINDNSAKSFELSGGKIEILTRNTRTDKLKASDISNVESINSFAKTFITSQKEMLKDDTHEYKNKLAVGDVVTIKCTSWEQHDDGHVSMSCVALDVHDCPEGVIEDEELIKGTYTEDIIPYLYGGDCIRGAIVLEAGEAPVFSIKQAYRAFAKERSKEDFRNNLVFEAKAVAVIDKIQRINWITSRGYGGISQMMDNIKEGDMAVMSILNRQDSGDNIYINIAPPKYGYEKIDERFEDENVILGFATDVKTAVENLKNLEECRKGDGMNDVVRSLARIILNSSTATDCLESYRRLLASSFLFNCIEDNDRANIALSKADYLKSCISFAQSGTPLPTSKSSVFSEDQRKILSALALFNTSGSVCQLASLIGDGEADSLCNKISELIMAREISASFNDEVKASSDGIRKKICELIGTASQFRIGEERMKGKYGKGETHHLEFKSSYVMKNDGSRSVPDIHYQGRGQVFEAVCAFLNSDEGGTVYIGVNNDGDPIVSPDYGLNADMHWLTANYQTINSIRRKQLGHNVPMADNLDHMVQFLNAEKELYFKESLLSNIRIEVTEDQDAIRIMVSPSLFEIAVLYEDKSHMEGESYMRDGGRTMPMSRHDKEKRLMNLKRISKDIGFIVTLQDAIDKQHKVIFRDYASGNSGTIKDRFVVPINLFYNDENVLCYDLEAKELKQFRLSRIGAIDVNVDNPVYSHGYKPLEADVFRWINEEKNFHIKARMDVGARNYLLEEYSNAKNLPSEELYEDSDGKWILDTTLHGLGAIRRFYLGLADKIEILQTEDSDLLEADIREYISKHLSRWQQ